MHLLKHRPKKDGTFVPIKSRWEVPEYRRLRGKRYNDRGEFVKETGASRRIDPVAQQLVRDAARAAAKMKRPGDSVPFNLNRLTPLPGNILVIRGPMVTRDGGIDLPEDKWRHKPWHVVVRVGPGVDCCDVGDRVVLQARHKPKDVWLGEKKFYMTRASVIAAVLL